MKNIDIKSIIIGALLTSTIFLGVAATSKADAGKWDENQVWATSEFNSIDQRLDRTVGWEPIGPIRTIGRQNECLYRKRVK